jgi:hypothetical protein
MLFKNPVSVRRLSVISLVVCYLSLLGFHYANQSIDGEARDLLTSEEFRRELPREISELASSKRPPATPKDLSKHEPYQFEAGVLPSHAPNQLQGEARYRYYEELAAHFDLRIRRRTVIGLRGLSPSGKRHDSNDNATMYDDTFIVLNPNQKSAVELLGSTHSGQFVSTLVPQGIAQIKPGLYRAEPCGEYAGMPAWLVTTPSGRESVPCWRDADGSGYIETNEKKQRLVATEILFHNGRYEDYGSSIGCQVLPPNLMERFIRLVGVNSSFDYLLIDANQKFE